MVVGKFVTRDLIIRMAQAVGKRLTAWQAAKYVPLAGQAVAAIMAYTAIRYLGEEHIKNCVRVAQEARCRRLSPLSSRMTHDLVDRRRP